MKPRRVAFFINTLVRGGTERNVVMLCQHIDRSRYLPEVWTLHEGGEQEKVVREMGIEVHCLQRSGSFDPRFALRAARRIARIEADLFHVFLPAIMFYVGMARVLFRFKPPIVYSEATTLVGHPWLRPLQAWMLRTQCAGYAANSVSSRAFLASQGVPLETIRLIPNGHDAARFAGPLDRDALRRSMNVGPDQRLVLFVGRLIDTKRVCDLIDALGDLGDLRQNLRVAIAGEGPLLKSLQTQVLQAGLGDNVQFLGARGDVPELLRSADLFVFPSEIEGLSNAVIESALAGLPIVGCDVGGVRDIVTNEREALLVPPRDPAALAAAMRRYLENPGLARSHAQAAQVQAQNSYSVDTTLQRLYALYDQVLHTRA